MYFCTALIEEERLNIRPIKPLHILLKYVKMSGEFESSDTLIIAVI